MSVMSEQRTLEEVGGLMKIGDLVILRTGRYNFAPQHGKPKWVFTDVVGVITDDRGFVDGTAEYKVYTVNNKHTWSHVDDLTIVE